MGVELYIGLMSGTSADGVDAVIARFDEGKFSGVDAAHHCPHPTALREALIQLGRNSQALVSLEGLAKLDVAVADQFACAAQAVLSSAKKTGREIRAIGSHGQTVFHDPKGVHSSWQLGDPSRLAALTGITVAADFRRMDVALGGEGAPLVPAFHEAIFRSPIATAVINIGGIANITTLPPIGEGESAGYDCGPGNALLDEWALRHLGTPYDANGHFAAQGRVQSSLLDAWLAEPYFHQAPPKSTGRAQFNLEWADARAQGLQRHDAADVQASLCELTALSIASAVPAGTEKVLICGGGAFNQHLMGRLSALLPVARVDTTAAAGLPPQWVEAAAFAWLAHQRVHGLSGNLTAVTGARRAAVLGGLYG